MSVLLTKYTAIDVPRTEPISITYQLNKRCKTLPDKVSLAYFIKVLDMQEQYKAVMERAEQAKQFKEEFIYPLKIASLRFLSLHTRRRRLSETGYNVCFFCKIYPLHIQLLHTKAPSPLSNVKPFHI